MVFPEVRNQLGVAMRGEAMAPALQKLPHLRIIEKLAVENRDDGAVLVPDRLLPVGQTDEMLRRRLVKCRSGSSR